MSIFLETERLIIKTPAWEDFEDTYILLSDPIVVNYVGQGQAKTREEVQRLLERAIEHQKKHGFSIGSIFEKETYEYVGRAGFIYAGYDDTQPEIEINCLLHKKFWDKGYATELGFALLSWAFKHLAVPKIIAVIHPNNKGSQYVTEKAGLRYVGNAIYYGIELAKYEIYKADFIKESHT